MFADSPSSIEIDQSYIDLKFSVGNLLAVSLYLHDSIEVDHI